MNENYLAPNVNKDYKFNKIISLDNSSKTVQ